MEYFRRTKKGRVSNAKLGFPAQRFGGRLTPNPNLTFCQTHSLVNTRDLSTFNHLLLDKGSIPKVVVNRIPLRITLRSTHHGEHGLQRELHGLF
jgi:hypothetical protein